MQEVGKESLKDLFKTTERLKETVEKIKQESEYLAGTIFNWEAEIMWGSEKLINFVFYRGNDDYPLAQGTYKAENLPVKVGSTFWFFHPDAGVMQAYYVDTIETAIGEDKTYVCAFSRCSDEFVRKTVKYIHKIAY